ncbi:MAG: hydrogenase expression/formation protein HypE [Anaerolineae bacterium]|jgi:hydrogenase expression/formation protein HypE|nr:hydrogenase expression/formation protein HypE [Anaerolineae bacterium]
MTDQNYPAMEGPVCPMPLPHDKTIVMGHGAGGKMSQELIQQLFQARFISPALQEGNDFGRLVLPEGPGHLAVSTDMHMVSPLFFPGGDIGKLAVCGTVNDMAMSGGKPLAITVSFILEEGLDIKILSAVVDSMATAAKEAGVEIIAGDTKVAGKGEADQIFINTTGIAWVPEDRIIGGQYAKPGDKVILSGTMGDHGIAVLAARGELGFEIDTQSDVAPLNALIEAVLEAAPNTHVLRDPTRGGVGTTLNEIAKQSHTSIWLEETALPIQPAVQAACEMLGFDPLYIANEGKLIVICPTEQAESALNAMKNNPFGENAVVIGEVKASDPGKVLLRTLFGTTRFVDSLAGEILPRIC